MKAAIGFSIAVLIVAVALLGGCAPATEPAQSAQQVDTATGAGLRVLAIETFLTDIAQNVVGDRLRVDALMPLGVDPHSFEPTPSDVRKVAESDVLIINGAGFEGFLDQLLRNAGGQRTVIEASKGLTPRRPQEGERGLDDAHAGEEAEDEHEEGDPHFWLDPTLAVRYVETIRDGLIAADPDGKAVYDANAAAYVAKLNELDGWIKEQVAGIPAERRLLVTNHESFGYFADRYGFRIVGAIIPSVSTGASPSAQQLAALADQVRATGAPAIFLETGASEQLAQQLAQETGIAVVTGLLTHSVTEPGGPAPDYISMMRYNVETIVAALTGEAQ